MYPARCKLSMAARGARGDQRISVISSTSSNTTSGIVSDRVHSEDEPDTAPASTESLPRLIEYPNHSQAQPVTNGTNGDEHSRPSSPASTIDGKSTEMIRSTDEYRVKILPDFGIFYVQKWITSIQLHHLLPNGWYQTPLVQRPKVPNAVATAVQLLL